MLQSFKTRGNKQANPGTNLETLRRSTLVFCQHRYRFLRMSWHFIILAFSYFPIVWTYNWDQLNLPEDHIPFYFNNNPDVKKICYNDSKCPFRQFLDTDKCWGYEPACEKLNRYAVPDCSGDSKRWTNSKDEQEYKFWSTADFGMIYERRTELKMYCQPRTKEDSSLQCAKYLRYCKATNLFIDLSSKPITKGNERDRYREDLLGPGQIGGHCKMDTKALKMQGEHKSPLQSWFAELQHFSSLQFHPSKKENCDITFDKPTYIMKLDAGINMYHHFCDFVNLYASQHVNNSFGTDVNIIMWDTTTLPYGDLFSETWKAFTDHPIIPLKNLDGKRVCIKDAAFSLLPRMRYGLYYNMPLIPGCFGSSLIKAFSEHVLHRLNLKQAGPRSKKIRVTLLSRNTQYRNILNQNELVKAMKSDGELEVSVVEYNRNMPFEEQLGHSLNSDIFIGIHGAGLTHLLFQPDWAAVIELYNCQDSGCYYDLARLRGLKYLTWENKKKLRQEDEGHHPTLGAHAKFTNYAFDVEEFMRLVYKAALHVRNHPKFIKARQRKSKKDVRKEEL